MEEVLHTPYFEVTLNLYKRKFPEQEPLLRQALEPFDEQVMGNYSVADSSLYHGVSFPWSHISITSDLVRHIINRPDETNDKPGIRHAYFLFPAYGAPPDSNPFTMEDMAIDRYIRSLSRVARPMSAEKESVPIYDLYLMGSPFGFGGRVNKDWTKAILANGYSEYGKLTAEFISQQIPSAEETRIILQGVSKGGAVAAETFRYLPPELQQITLCLLDNPAGTHDPNGLGSWVRGTLGVAGFMGEMAIKMAIDDEMKMLTKSGGSFLEEFSHQSGIPLDDQGQARLNRNAALAEVVVIARGTKLDRNQRIFIRDGLYDPMRINLPKIMDYLRDRINRPLQAVPSQDGQILTVPFRGYHAFFYNRFERWSKILEFINR